MASSSDCYVNDYDTIGGLGFTSAPPPLATAADVAAINNRSPGRSPLRNSQEAMGDQSALQDLYNTALRIPAPQSQAQAQAQALHSQPRLFLGSPLPRRPRSTQLGSFVDPPPPFWLVSDDGIDALPFPDNVSVHSATSPPVDLCSVLAGAATDYCITVTNAYRAPKKNSACTPKICIPVLVAQLRNGKPVPGMHVYCGALDLPSDCPITDILVPLACAPAKPHALTRKRSADNDGNDEAGNLSALESLDPMLQDPEIEPSCECCGGHIDCPNLQMCECRGHPYCCDSCTIPAPDKNDPDRYCFLCLPKPEPEPAACPLCKPDRCCSPCVPKPEPAACTLCKKPLLGYTSDFDRCLACLELEEPFAPLHVDAPPLQPLPVYVAYMALKLLEKPGELPDIDIWEHKTSVGYNGEDKEYINANNDALGDTIALFRTKNPNPRAPFLHDFTILIDCSSAIQQWSPTVTCTQNLKFQARRDERGLYILIEESVVPPQDHLKKLVDFFGRTAPAPALKRLVPLTSSSDESRIAKSARCQASPSPSESSRSLRNLTFDLPFGMTLTAPPESHALLHYMCEEVIRKICENSA